MHANDEIILIEEIDHSFFALNVYIQEKTQAGNATQNIHTHHAKDTHAHTTTHIASTIYLHVLMSPLWQDRF